ncbi:hypothetical protein ACOSQ4_001183 [Xanthoceras sorbifolium]
MTIFFTSTTSFSCSCFSVIPLPYVSAELCRSKKINKHKIQPKVKCSLSDMFSCYKMSYKLFYLLLGLCKSSPFLYKGWSIVINMSVSTLDDPKPIPSTSLSSTGSSKNLDLTICFSSSIFFV